MHTREGRRDRRGFDFTLAMHRLCGDMVARLPELGHIDIRRVATSFRQSRPASRRLLFATLTPLRFEGGRDETVRRGRRYRLQRLVGPAGEEMLYIVTFYLPRYLDLPFEEKISTAIHELWHIGPRFDGDVRRFPGRHYAHGSSRKRYDDEMRRLGRRWLDLAPPDEIVAFLRDGFRDLAERHGRIYGRQIAPPRHIPTG